MEHYVFRVFGPLEEGASALVVPPFPTLLVGGVRETLTKFEFFAKGQAIG